MDELSSQYTHSIILYLKHDNVLTDDLLWTSKIPYILKKIRYVFDIYDVEYSEPVIQEIEDKDDCKAMCKYILNFRGYKYLSAYKTLEESIDEYNGPGNYMYIAIHFNLPKVHSYISACKFISNITKSIWKNTSYGQYVLTFAIWTKDLWTDAYHIDHIHKYKLMTKSTSMRISRLLNMFFPEDDRWHIKDELDRNKDLLVRLCNCFY